MFRHDVNVIPFKQGNIWCNYVNVIWNYVKVNAFKTMKIIKTVPIAFTELSIEVLHNAEKPMQINQTSQIKNKSIVWNI